MNYTRPLKIPRWFADSVYYFSWLILFLLFICYWISDRYWIGQMIGLWPAWFWLLGIWLLILISHQTWKRTTVLITGWLFFLLIFSEEWLWIGHIFRPSINQDWELRHKKWTEVTETGVLPDNWDGNYPIRLISYNLNGNLEAIRFVSKFQPDICLFQESPNSKLINQDILNLFGSKSVYIDGGDCAILSRLPVQPLPELSLKYAGPAVRSKLDLPNHPPIYIINLRLLLPELGLNIFSSSIWKQTMETQKWRDEQMDILMDYIKEYSKKGDILLGGDFNRPARSASLNPVRMILQDTYAKSGIGWGNTMTTEFPVSRIDQIWIPKNWIAVKSRVINSKNSDHRILISDIDIPNKKI